MKKSSFPEDKEFVFVVDFTWAEGGVTLLEMGDYYTSCISGLDQIRKTAGQSPLENDINANLRKKYPKAIYLKDISCRDSIFQSLAIEFQDFEQGTQYEYNIKSLYPVSHFLKARSATPKIVGPMRDLVVSLGSGLSLGANDAAQYESLMEFPNNLILLNFVSGGLYFSCFNKVVFYLFNQNSENIPATCLVDLHEFNPDRVSTFLSQHDDQELIIKPTNMSKGTGVHLISKLEVLAFLTELNQYQKFQSKKGPESPDGYWAYARDRFLLLQTCCPSKTNETGHRPTGRAVIRAKFPSNGEPLQLEYLGGYWKLPAEASKELSTASVVSDVHANDKLNVSQINSEDWEAIKSDLNQNFTPILQKMFHTSTVELMKLFQNHHDIVMQRYWKDLFMLESQPPLIAGKLDTLIVNALNLHSGLYYRTPGSMDYLNHFISAALGLFSDVPCINYEKLKAALYTQLGMEVKLPAAIQSSRNESDKDEGNHKKSLQQGSSSINCSSTVFSPRKNHTDSQIENGSESWFPCSLL